MMQERKRQNKKIMNRLYAIMHESREPGSHEYAPGYRMNHQMIPVIDCYPTTLHVCKNFAKLHGAIHERRKIEKTVIKKNAELHKHLLKIKSPYTAESFEKDYQKKKALFDIKKIPHSALHLLRASHPNSPPPLRVRSASPPDNRCVCAITQIL
jgi:hypothetical protein